MDRVALAIVRAGCASCRRLEHLDVVDNSVADGRKRRDRRGVDASSFAHRYSSTPSRMTTSSVRGLRSAGFNIPVRRVVVFDDDRPPPRPWSSAVAQSARTRRASLVLPVIPALRILVIRRQTFFCPKLERCRAYVPADVPRRTCQACIAISRSSRAPPVRAIEYRRHQSRRWRGLAPEFRFPRRAACVQVPKGKNKT